MIALEAYRGQRPSFRVDIALVVSPDSGTGSNN
jgi:hypothetical protein